MTTYYHVDSEKRSMGTAHQFTVDPSQTETWPSGPMQVDSIVAWPDKVVVEIVNLAVHCTDAVFHPIVCLDLVSFKADGNIVHTSDAQDAKFRFVLRRLPQPSVVVSPQWVNYYGTDMKQVMRFDPHSITISLFDELVQPLEQSDRMLLTFATTPFIRHSNWKDVV